MQDTKPLQEPVLYGLPSIIEPIDPAHLFGREQPLEVELGCGDGSFLTEYAELHSQTNFLATERLLGRIRKLQKKAQKKQLRNLRAVRIESSYFLKYLLPRHSVSAIHIYFPDPWPKRKHQRHRLINEAFPAIAERVLTATGTVFLRTDDANYFGQMLEVFEACPEFRSVETPMPLQSVLTDFERDFLARAISTLRAAYQRR